MRDGSKLESRLNMSLERQTARIAEMDADSLQLDTERFDTEQPSQIFLNLAREGRLYFFSVAKRSHAPADGRICVEIPRVLFYTERRDHPRRPPSTSHHDPTRVALQRNGHGAAEARIDDLCAEGMLLRVPEDVASTLPDSLTIDLLDGEHTGQRLFGEVRRREDRTDSAGSSDEAGWRRIGISTSAVPSGPAIPVERRETILAKDAGGSLRRRLKMISAAGRLTAGRALQRVTGRSVRRPEIRIVEFQNPSGESIKGIIDATFATRAESRIDTASEGSADLRGAPLVLIPPAWAKTKETLLPLARTIVESFERVGEPVVVVRLDGIRRRGESHNDPECSEPGSECHHMTFSQGAADIRAAIDHFASSPDYQPSKIVLVTFSGAAIEARRALCEEGAGHASGWVSVVGAADLKSGLRTVSGGVDYIGAAANDVRFGVQRVLGIEVDIDNVATDAVDQQLAYLEDARREMAQLDLPITWIQGKYDAWIDPARVQNVLSCGDTSQRKLIEVPTGHQLRSSQEALETFQLVAQEIGRIVLDRDIRGSVPDLADLERRRQAERARLRSRQPEIGSSELQGFWRDYLLGRERRLGMELLTISSPYRALMKAQVEALALQPGLHIGDLGSGTGALPLHLLGHGPHASSLAVDEIDYVPEALERARLRIAQAGPSTMELRYIECDLDESVLDSPAQDGAAQQQPVPLEDGRYDRVLASLLLNYLRDPEALLSEARRLLRPGGRLVLSTLRRDVDISRIYRDVAAELQAGAAREALGEPDQRLVEADLRDFLNEAARLVDLEERGVFHFWDADELVELMSRAGFERIKTRTSFGDPPQAIVASGVRA